MVFSESRLSCEQRLSRQLHSLSELSEFLTLRILEIEEKLGTFEKILANKDDDTESIVHD